ncbi:hypothetical protein ABS198_21445, partial [Acinetobacter baumannii]|uniref:hypothetical protein n=1 Tax=Acinetobacter baumannii TaxID=470 RepID=UPI00331CB0D8
HGTLLAGPCGNAFIRSLPKAIMSSSSFRQSLRRLWGQDKFSYSIRVTIALTGSLALCWYQNEMGLLIPLFLGIIASALAETDDSWQG